MSRTRRTRILAAAAGISLVLYGGNAPAFAEDNSGGGSSTIGESTGTSEGDDDTTGFTDSRDGTDVPEQVDAPDQADIPASTDAPVPTEPEETGADETADPSGNPADVPAETLSEAAQPQAPEEDSERDVDAGPAPTPSAPAPNEGSTPTTEPPLEPALVQENSGPSDVPTWTHNESPTVGAPPAASPVMIGSLTVTIPPATTLDRAGLVGFFALLGSPFLNGGTTVPTNPLQWALLWWTRRVANAQPTSGAAPTVGPVVDGQITGDLNIVDRDGDPLGYTVIGVPTKGTVVVNSDGTFTYTPSAGLIEHGGTDTFTVRASDAGQPHIHGLTGLLRGLLTGDAGHTVTKTVTISVASPETVTVVETPNPTTGIVSGSLGDYIGDSDDDPLTFTGPVTSTRGGTVVIGADGTFTYTPSDEIRHRASSENASDADLFDTFTVTVSDGTGAPRTVGVRVAVGPANATPGFTHHSHTLDTQTGSVTGTLVADDVDGDSLTFSGDTTSTKGGTVVVNADGTYTYTPTAAMRHEAARTDGTVTDTFTVRVSDGHGGTTTLEAEAVIAPANQAPHQTGAPVVGPANPSTGVVAGSLADMFADDDGDSLTFGGKRVSHQGGVVHISRDGTFEYIPTAAIRHAAAVPGADTTDAITVSALDGHGGVTTVEITVPISPANAVPTFAGYGWHVEDSLGTVVGTVDFADTDNDTLTFSGPTTSTRGGAVVVNTDGSFTYTPTLEMRYDAGVPGASMDDTFTVVVDDGHGGVATRVVKVGIVPAYAAPAFTNVST